MMNHLTLFWCALVSFFFFIIALKAAGEVAKESSDGGDIILMLLFAFLAFSGILVFFHLKHSL